MIRRARSLQHFADAVLSAIAERPEQSFHDLFCESVVIDTRWMRMSLYLRVPSQRCFGPAFNACDWHRCKLALIDLLLGEGPIAALRLPLACCLIVGCTHRHSATVSHEFRDGPRQQMRRAINAGNWADAARFANQALHGNPDDSELLSQLALIHARDGNKRKAAAILAESVKVAEYSPVAKVTLAVQGLIEVGEVYAAIELLEESLVVHPESDALRRMLIGFYLEVQRPDRVPDHLLVLIRHRAFDVHLLTVTTDHANRRLSNSTSQRLLKRNPDDLRVCLPDAFLLLSRRDGDGAAEVLREILERHRQFAPAYAMLGQALVAAGRYSELDSWGAESPSGCEQFVDYWLTLADRAASEKRHAEAVRASWEATLRDPCDERAWDRLRQSVGQLEASASEFRDRVPERAMATLSTHLDQCFEVRERINDFSAGDSVSQKGASEIAKALLSLGRHWEAEAWASVAMTLSESPDPQLSDLRREIVSSLRKDPSWVSGMTGVATLDFSAFPLPQLRDAWSVPTTLDATHETSPTDQLRMSEQSRAWGLESVGGGNDSALRPQASLIRTTGVGGGAIDYDQDGLPDLVVMNAAGDMLEKNSQPNQLMRNIGHRFVSVGHFAKVDQRDFGQGVVVGDFNEDGFPDLFFANLGENHLLQNNGDGTFTDRSDALVSERISLWSTSGAFVDLNGDSITDLVVTNYCRAVPELNDSCVYSGQVKSACHPLVYPGEADQVYLGDGSGRLLDVTDQWMEEAVPGRGLGLVAGALHDQKVSVLIANDMTRNTFYEQSSLSDQPPIVESAAVRGVAVDARSLAQASMGIASSDFDGDGDLDFYVTGFGREYNVYYEQYGPGIWGDVTAKLDLIEPTLKMVGFGTEAVDVDNDGVDEIIVTNGHVGEFSYQGSDDLEQFLQIFHRGVDGRFDLVDDDRWGHYFRQPHVGRALWTVDVNRDGRQDVCVTHTREPVALLLNESEPRNRCVGFRLVSTACSRDAVGAVVRFRVGDREKTLWRLSGDGYFCSNEKLLISGLGTNDQIRDVTVTWQDGSMDRIGTLEANSQYLIVQGQREASVIHRYQPAGRTPRTAR